MSEKDDKVISHRMRQAFNEYSLLCLPKNATKTQVKAARDIFFQGGYYIMKILNSLNEEIKDPDEYKKNVEAVFKEIQDYLLERQQFKINAGTKERKH